MSKPILTPLDSTKDTRTSDLLIEIGTEELPAKGLEILSENFSHIIASLITKENLTFNNIKTFVTPRRLAVVISDLLLFQPDRVITKKGPPKSQAYDEEGNPTEILKRFTKNDPFVSLTEQETPKGIFIVLEQKEKGKKAHELIPDILQKSLETLPLPNRMRWDSLEESFLRPIHWVVMLLGNETLTGKYFEINVGNATLGHRSMRPMSLTLTSPQVYESLLEKEGKVIPDFQKRKLSIKTQIQDVCNKHHATPILNENLLDEVSGLVEWPVVLLGSFSKNFLNLPKEVLITSMETHQKCFAMQDKQGNLLPHFLIISNIESTDPKCVIQGNENVIHARLADAVFYFKKDQEVSLENRRSSLKQVVFQQGLSTLWDKSERIADLANIIGKGIGADLKETCRAASLCKTDLLTHLVDEFPELQGIMGKYYALHDKESEKTANALSEHYYPRFSQDRLPATKEGTAIALADRIDTLVGLFALNKRPTGEKDPFALRRQTLAILRILIEGEYRLDLLALFNEASQIYAKQILNAKESKESYFKNASDIFNRQEFITPLLEFSFERLRAFMAEKAIPTRVFDAVLETKPTSPYDFYRRILAVHNFTKLPEAESLANANKRVKNILAKIDIPAGDIDNTLLKEEAERNLLQILIKKKEEISPLMQQEQYEEALKKLAELKEPVDLFFDKVMVMVEEEKLKNNRLKLLNQLRHLFLQIADVSVL